MIVVEDRTTNEVVRFLILDAYVKLGVIQYGADTQNFDPQRLYRYYALVENQLFDYANRYSDAFLYLPRRAYSHLSTPPILAEISASVATTDEARWFSDQFMVHPLTEISENDLPRYQQKSNVDSCYRWATQSENAIRLFHVADLDVDTIERIRWGTSIDASNLSRNIHGPVRNKLVAAVSKKLPLYIRIAQKDEISTLLEWLVLVKESGIKEFPILLSVEEHRGWERELSKLLQMPGMHLLTSGAAIASLSDIIKEMKRNPGERHWSEKIIFASSYPETQRGDSITEILSFLLSRNLGASRSEVQRILAGNLVNILTSITDQLDIEYNDASIYAEGLFGKSALREFLRLFRLLIAQKQVEVLSAEMVPDEAGSHLDCTSLILTLRDLKRKRYRRVLIQKERDESLRIAGWKESYESILSSRNWVSLRTQARASDKGPPLDSPSHISTFNRGLLTILGVRDTTSVLSSLHYKVQPKELEIGRIALCEEDIRAIGVQKGDIVIVLDADSEHYWGATVETASDCPTRKVGISPDDMQIYGLTESSQIDLVKNSDEIVPCESVLLTYRSTPRYTDAEIMSILHMLKDDLERAINGRLVGIGTRLVTSTGLELEVNQTVPNLRRGELCLIKDAEIGIHPIDLLNEMNVILLMANGNEMIVRDGKVTNPRGVRRSLENLAKMIPEMKPFITDIQRYQTRWSIAAITALGLINVLRYNRSQGKFGLVFVDRLPRKFTIQKYRNTQDYINFDGDMRNDEIFKSLVYSILDAEEVSDVATDPKTMFRAAAEMAEDIEQERPTLMLLMLSELGNRDELYPYLQILAAHKNLHILIIVIGKQIGEIDAQIEDVKNLEIVCLKEYSSFDFHDLVIARVRQLCHI